MISDAHCRVRRVQLDSDDSQNVDMGDTITRMRISALLYKPIILTEGAITDQNNYYL